MIHWVSYFLVLILMVNIFLLGSSRIRSCIDAVALQGFLLGGLPFITHSPDTWSLHLIFLSLFSMATKGVALPLMLKRALRIAKIKREIEPYVGYCKSLGIGLIFLGFSWWISSRIQLSEINLAHILLPAGVFSVFVGLFLIIARRKAIMQALGYLVFENGIFLFGVSVAAEEPFMVELGIMLDVVVGVFLMGIVVFQLQQELDNTENNRSPAESVETIINPFPLNPDLALEVDSSQK